MVMITVLTALTKALTSPTSNAYCRLKKIEQYFLGKASYPPTGLHRGGDP